MVDEVVFSSESGEWITPEWLFNALDAEFEFDLDPAASDGNAKCDNYMTVDDDGLARPWFDPEDSVSSVFVNPPYGREVGNWVAKAYEESQRGATVVMLLPARTDVAWFHDYVLGRAEIRFIRGRIKFLVKKPTEPAAVSGDAAPFPSMVIVFRPPWQKSY